MNLNNALTWLEHSVLACIGQFIMYMAGADSFTGGFAMVLFFLGREVGGHEFKGIVQLLPVIINEGVEKKQVRVKNLNDLHIGYGLIRHWNFDSVMDVIVPAVSVALLSLVLG